MFKLIIILLTIISFSFCSKLNIAVIELDADGVTTGEARTITSKLRNELIKTGNFEVIERGKMNEILKEQGFQNTGCTSQECVVEMGRLIGVNKIIAGDIGKVGKLHIINLRIINVATGKVEKAVEEITRNGLEEVYLDGIKRAVAKLPRIKGYSSKKKRYAKIENEPNFNNEIFKTLEKVTNEPILYTVKVWVTMSALRDDPSFDSNYLKMLDHGYRLTVISEHPRFLEVNYKGYKCWINKVDVQKIKI